MTCFGSGTCILTADRRHRKLGTYAPAACQGDQAAIEGDEQDDTGYTDALYYRSLCLNSSSPAQALTQS